MQAVRAEWVLQAAILHHPVNQDPEEEEEGKQGEEGEGELLQVYLPVESLHDEVVVCFVGFPL